MNRRAVALALVLMLAAASSPGPSLAKQPAGSGSSGVGQVFFPNPVAQLQDESLTDQKDADYPALQPAYRLRPLTNLDGSGYLCGDWACVSSETGDPAYSVTNTFVYNRHDDRFEQVMTYYWITEAQKYIQSLGFGSIYPGVNNRPQLVRINQLGYDNSFATDHPKYELRFGKGGVDDAEDAEVILHEYGHALHFQSSPTFYGAGEQSGAIGEGFGDYWAADFTNILAPTPDPACVADWDSVSYTAGPIHCLRRLDTTKMFPADLDGEVHSDGEIWSHALWNLRTALGHVHADTAVLLAQIGQDNPTMPSLATDIVETVRDLYGNAEATAAQAAFADRGIL
jgi:zinc metalloprotease ZmpB